MACHIQHSGPLPRVVQPRRALYSGVPCTGPRGDSAATVGGCCGIRRNSDAVEGAPEVCRLPLRLAASLWAPLTSALLLFATAGCGSRVSDEELGRIVPGPPPIPAGYEPYELPDLTPSPGDATDGPATPEEPPASASEQRGESMEELAQPVAPVDAPASPPSAPGPPDATIRDADA